MNVSMKTIELKLFKPSLTKRMVMDEALDNYSRAYEFLLNKAYKEIDLIEEKYIDSIGRYRAKNISKWITKEISKELNMFNIEPFKDSIKIDFSSTLASYLTLKIRGEKVSFPTAFAENPRPIFFCRYSKTRNYSMLYDSDNDRYYAKIYLMNVKNQKRKKVDKIYNSEIRYIDTKKEVFKESDNKKSYITFSLAFGKWQEGYLKDALENPEILKTARLIKRKKEYYLSINIAKNIENLIDTINYMGISRGNENAINYTVIDEKCSIICEGYEELEGNISNDKLNAAANILTKIAKENRSQVVMEKLLDKGDGLTFKDKQGKNVVPKINCSNYNKLYDIINCKLKDNGMKDIIRVSGVSIFNTCPFCNHRSKANRFSNKIMICTSCGMTTDVDKAGSLNLARRLIQYSNEKIEILVENTDKGIRFTNEDLNLLYYPSNPFDCFNEFMVRIDEIIKIFYSNINLEKENKNFKRKLSTIKKLEKRRDILQLVEKK